jgi:arsenate reductase
MDGLLVYHNPVCGQSRGAEEILRDRGVAYQVIRYLDHPLSREDFERILALLPNEPADLVRKDKRFQELGLNEADYQTPEQVIDVLLVHPELMQRPIIIRGDRAVLARPSEKVLELLD